MFNIRHDFFPHNEVNIEEEKTNKNQVILLIKRAIRISIKILFFFVERFIFY